MDVQHKGKKKMSDYHPYGNSGTIPINAQRGAENNIENGGTDKNSCVRFLEIIREINQVSGKIESNQNKRRAHDAKQGRNFMIPFPCNHKYNLFGKKEQHGDAADQHNLERHVEFSVECFNQAKPIGLLC